MDTCFRDFLSLTLEEPVTALTLAHLAHLRAEFRNSTTASSITFLTPTDLKLYLTILTLKYRKNAAKQLKVYGS